MKFLAHPLQIFTALVGLHLAVKNRFIDEYWQRSVQLGSFENAWEVLVALRFSASGSFQSVIGEVGHLSQASTSRIVNNLGQALVLIAGEAICFPTTQRAASLTSIGFLGIAGFPRVLGCIVGTHVAVKVSKEDKPVYLNRKGYTSINVQAV